MKQNYKNSRSFFRYTTKAVKFALGISLWRFLSTPFYSERLWNPQIASYLIDSKGSLTRGTAVGLKFAFRVFILIFGHTHYRKIL